MSSTSILKVCPRNMHNLVLGCLLDLCENPKTIHHVLTWRGQDAATAAHLFCEIWRTEEREMGVRRNQNGAIVGELKDISEVCDHGNYT